MKKLNPAITGAFVVGAVAIAILATAIFGSGKFFRKVHTYVLFFTGDVNGLKVGAPVKLKGVEIGRVKNVLLNVGSMAHLDDKGDFRIPVVIDLDEENIAQKGAKVRPDRETMQGLVDRGLRAQLSMESIVTGLLYVKFDLQPTSPLRMVNDPTVPYPELPTLPTALEEVQIRASEFLAQLESVDFQGLIASLHGALDGANELLNSPDLKRAVATLDETMGKVDTLIAEFDRTVGTYGELARTTENKVSSLTTSLDGTAEDTKETLRVARETLETYQSFAAPDAPLIYQLGRTLEDVSVAAKSVRRFAEELERNPAVLVRGKANGEVK